MPGADMAPSRVAAEPRGAEESAPATKGVVPMADIDAAAGTQGEPSSGVDVPAAFADQNGQASNAPSMVPDGGG